MESGSDFITYSYDLGNDSYNPQSNQQYNNQQYNQQFQQQQYQPPYSQPYNDPFNQSYNDPYSDPYVNEPPLMEELEINLDHIMQKTWAVLTFKNLDKHKNILHEPDLAGPLVFLLTFGFLLLLTGKIQFGYIYGLGTLGCLIIYFVVHLIAPKNISFMCTVSVLGYCLLPMVILSGTSILINLRATLTGNIFALLAVLWCAIGASNLLVTAIDTTNSRLVIAYPCALFYTVFALLTVF